MRKLGLIITFWLASITLPASSLALGLGEIDVSSFLNQPLKAEIQVISARAGEIDDLLVSLASRDAFTRAGLSRPNHLSELRFAVKKNEGGDSAVILVTTKKAVKEPFLNFLVEADWSKGRVLREFTVLLDPPFYADSSTPTESSSQPSALVEEAVVSDSAQVEQPTSTQVIASNQQQLPTQVAATSSQSNSTNNADQAQPLVSQSSGSATDDIVIVKEDTLWSIASQFKDSAHSMAQVMLAMQRSNPRAFGNGNINNLKVGAVLRAPSAEELNRLSKQDAYAQVLEQNGLWDDYVARAGGKPAVAKAGNGGSEGGEGESSSGALSLVAPGDGKSDAGSLQSDGQDTKELRTKLALAEEELDAARIENQEMQSRISDLQARLDKFEELQKIVEIEDNSLAQLQAEQALEPQESTAKVVDSSDTLTDAGADAEAALAEEQQEVEQQEVEQPSASVTPPPAPVIVTEPTQQSPSMLDGIFSPETLKLIPSLGAITGDPVILGALAGIVVLLLLLVVYKRRKNAEPDDVAESDDLTNDDNSLFAEEDLTPIHLAESGLADEAAVNESETAGSSVQDTLESTAVISQVDIAEEQVAVPEEEPVSEDQDDVLNEVDVYLAYGLYDNAEDLLTQNLEATPDRADYRAKLLDTYFATRNASGFVKEAETLKSMGSVAARYWDRVQVMGYELAPDNALFSGGKDSNISAAELEIAKPAVADFDLGGSEDDTNFSSTDFNLGDDALELDEPVDLSMTQQVSAPEEVADLSDELPQDFGLDDVAGDSGELDFSFDDDPVSDAEGEEYVDFGLPDDLDLSAADLESSDVAKQQEPEPVEAEADAGIEFDIEEPLADDEQSQETGNEDLELSVINDEPESTSEDIDADLPIDLDFSVTGDDEDDQLSIDSDLDYEATSIVDITGVVDVPSDAEAEAMVAADSDLIAGADLELESDLEPTAVTDVVEDAGTTDSVDLMFDLDDAGLLNADLDDGADKNDSDLSTNLADHDDELSVDDEAQEPKTGTFAPGDFDGPEEVFVAQTDIEGVDLDGGDFDGVDLEGVDLDGVDIDDISELMLPDDVDEVSTKLDLARAFIDMGDTEGARSSLNEVLAEGSDDQKAEATQLLDQI